MIEVIPGILEKSFDEIKHKISLVRDYAPWAHIDVLDGTLVPNTTFNTWNSFKIFDGAIKLEAHLMVAHPELYVADLAANGFDRLIAHVEVDSIREFLVEAKHHHIERGVALDAPSDLETIEPFLDEVDTVLIMMYKAGASGGEFEREQLPKIRKIHEEYKELPIEVDGGISKETAPLVVNNGATRLVSTSYLFWKNSQRIPEAIEELRAEPLRF
jgi:ribulose-phosphate 3-epimerase